MHRINLKPYTLAPFDSIIQAYNIDDYVRCLRKEGFKRLKWGKQSWELLKKFLIYNGFEWYGDGTKYMGLMHYKEND